MAIKGKKKSQSRGSHARRRPASAPRPLVGPRREPWYRTQRGRAIAAVVLVIVVGVAWWAIARAQERAADLELNQAVLEEYTGELRALLQTVRPAAQGMNAAVGPGGVDAIGDEVPAWTATLRRARTEARATFAAPVVAEVHALVSQSIDLYRAAASTYELVPDAPKQLQDRLIARASAQRDSAASIWVAAVAVLDRERAREELDPSGLAAPSTPPPGVQAPSSPPADGAGAGG
jgi:hypothetical protein